MGHSVWKFGRIVNKLKLQLNEMTYIVLQSLTHVWRSPSLCESHTDIQFRSTYTSTFT